MKKLTDQLSALICTLILFGCQSNSDNTTIDDTQEITEVADTTAKFKPAPTQEELIKQHKVKTMRVDYEGLEAYRIDHWSEDGFLTKREFFDGEKLTADTYEYKLDEQGRIAEEIDHQHDGLYITKYEYDEKGRELRIELTEPDKKSVNTYSYNDQLNKRTEAYALGINETFYNKFGLDSVVNYYRENGKSDGSVGYTYDSLGNNIQIVSTLYDIDYTETRTYNDQRQLLRMYREGIGFVVQIDYEYNDKGLYTKDIKTGVDYPLTRLYSYEYFE